MQDTHVYYHCKEQFYLPALLLYGSADRVGPGSRVLP